MSEQVIQEQMQPEAATGTETAEVATAAPAAAPAPAQNKKNLSELFHRYANVKTISILRLVLGGLLALLGAFQLAHYAMQIIHTYPQMLDGIWAQDFSAVAGGMLSLVFFFTMLVVVIVTVVSLIRKDHLVRFEIATTILAVYTVGLFLTQQLPQACSVFLVNQNLIGWAIVVITVLFAFLRLFAADVSARIVPLIFSLFAAAAVVAFVALDCGNFLTVQLPETTIPLSDLRFAQYMHVMSNFLNLTPVTEGPEYLFLMAFSEYLPNESVAYVVLVILPQMLILAGNALLKVTAISLLGYLIHVFTGPNYLQHHNLRACQRVCISMLITSILYAGAAVLLMLIPEWAGDLTSSAIILLDYQNIIITFVLLITLIVLTTVPWTMYRSSYRRRLAAYNASVRRGNV